jgi:Homotrimeric ring hydroxylase
MRNFYETGDGWNKEILCRRLDNALTAWRKLARRYSRGIQEAQPSSHQMNGHGSSGRR